MDKRASHVLPDGRELEVSIWEHPLAATPRAELIELLQQAFPRTDVDWLQSLRGGYADVLSGHAVVGRIAGVGVGHAGVAFARRQPEVCVLMDVLTVSAHRGQGIARRLTERAVSVGFAAGCRVAYLGNARSGPSVYETIDFERLSGIVMRRPKPGCEDCEADLFAAGQPVCVRPTNWGDLPGVVCLMAQPMSTLLAQYSQGLTSTAHVPGARCVSNFTSVKYECEARGGMMFSLVSRRVPHRVFGFATAVPGPGPLRCRTARLDVVAHDHYHASAAALVEALTDWCQANGTEQLEAFVADCDTAKKLWLADAGLTLAATLPRALQVAETWHAVQLYRRQV